MYRGWTQTDYQNKHYNINQKDEGTLDDRGRDGWINFILRIKEQETRLALQEHDDDDDDDDDDDELFDIREAISYRRLISVKTDLSNNNRSSTETHCWARHKCDCSLDSMTYSDTILQWRQYVESWLPPTQNFLFKT